MKIPKAAPLHQKATRHAKVHQQAAATVKVQQQVFRATAEGRDARSGQNLHQIHRQSPSQIGPPCLGAGDHSPFQMRQQTTSDRLDFGQFWQSVPFRRIVPRAYRPYLATEAADGKKHE